MRRDLLYLPVRECIYDQCLKIQLINLDIPFHFVLTQIYLLLIEKLLNLFDQILLELVKNTKLGLE